MLEYIALQTSGRPTLYNFSLIKINCYIKFAEISLLILSEKDSQEKSLDWNEVFLVPVNLSSGWITFSSCMLQAQNRVHEFLEEARNLLVNQVVMTSYNKKTYTIGGIEMDKKVTSPYKEGNPESFLEYYERVCSRQYQNLKLKRH